MPRVSVVIPARNAERFIAEAVDSVLAQTYRDFEIIVVDDGSTDRTAALLAGYGAAIRRLPQPSRGVSAARNAAIRAASGELMAFLDADDIWLPDKLQRQTAFMDRHRGAALHFADFEVVGPEGLLSGSGLSKKKIWPALGAAIEGLVPDAFYHLLTEGYMFPSVTMVRRQVLEALGGFDERLGHNEDRELWLRISRTHPIGYTRAVLGRRRKHDAAVTSRETDQMLAQEAALLQSLPSIVGTLSIRERRAVQRRLHGIAVESAQWHLERGETRVGRAQLWQSIRSGVSRRSLRLAVAAYLPGVFLNALRRST